MLDNPKPMNIEQTREELQFAVGHDCEINKHDCILLSREDAVKLAEELDLAVELRAGQTDTSAYYVLDFETTTTRHTVATYFSQSVWDKSKEFQFSPSKDDEADFDEPF